MSVGRASCPLVGHKGVRDAVASILPDHKGAPVDKPELSGYRITLQQYDRHIRRTKNDPPGKLIAATFVVGMLAITFTVYLVTRDVGDTMVAGLVYTTFALPFSFAGSFMLGTMAYALWCEITYAVSWCQGDKDLPVRIREYTDACDSYQVAVAEAESERRRRDYEQRQLAWMQSLALRRRWTSLNGREFERAVGDLLKGFGYQVEWTGGAGDGGIDLVLKKEDTVTIVQCKQHKNPASPALVRDLYGTMNDCGADQAILACTSGFTRGTVNFARDKPIMLLSVDDLVKMATELNRWREQ